MNTDINHAQAMLRISELETEITRMGELIADARGDALLAQQQFELVEGHLQTANSELAESRRVAGELAARQREAQRMLDGACIGAGTLTFRIGLALDVITTLREQANAADARALELERMVTT